MNRSLQDKLITHFDVALRTIFAKQPAVRNSPAENIPDAALSLAQKNDCIGKMRVNHVGEVCAQALYQGQAITARNENVKKAMEQSAVEEIDHLAWCEQRISELGGRTSWLNPFWYGSSFLLGAVAGLVGDRWSLGFVAETERQVVAHLQDHLAKLPEQDERSRAIISQMIIDESHHAYQAENAGGAALPAPIPYLMSCTAKLMTSTAYYI